MSDNVVRCEVARCYSLQNKQKPGKPKVPSQFIGPQTKFWPKAQGHTGFGLFYFLITVELQDF